MQKNQLYYGDNLEVLRLHVPDESVDLVYLDPPFNSNQDYNVLFAEQTGQRAAAQIKAFEDTWRWDESAARAYEDVVEAGGRVSDAMRAFRTFLGTSDMMAYLAMMAPRLVELRRVMKPTASIYLHCDPTASHYLKMLMDAIFGPENFRNEIAWKRTLAHSSAKRFGPIHDTILFYVRSTLGCVWTDPKSAHSDEYISGKFGKTDADGRRFQDISLTGAGVRHGLSGSPWRGHNPTEKGRHWALPGKIVSALGIDEDLPVQEKLDLMDTAGRIYWSQTSKGLPRLKWYISDSAGARIPDVWADIPPINSQAQERLGYPTQKPEALLERIITASSNEGDLVLDPFCGCGTTIAAAERLGRRWIGIDITHLAINLVRTRLRDHFGDEVLNSFDVVGEPGTIDGARQLADQDKYQFQWWALGLVGARPAEQKKGADKGIDGRLLFHDDPDGKTKQVIISVKGGKLQAAYVRDLRGVIERENAEIGVLLSIEEPTASMRKEAASAGFYSSPWGSKHPRMQILTVGELLDGKRIDYPAGRQTNRTYKKAPKATKASKESQHGFFDESAD